MPRKLIEELRLLDEGRSSSSSSAIRVFSLPFRMDQRFRTGTITIAGWRISARFPPRMPTPYDHYDAMLEKACEVMDRYILRRPPSWAEVAAQFSTPEEALIFQKFYLGSAADIAEYFFESPQMQAVVAASGLIGTFRGPRDSGTGYVKLYHSMGMATGHRGRWTYVKGAMGSVTQALQPHRGKARSGDPAGRRCRADHRQGRSRDWRCPDQRRGIEANVVLSNADPKRTYLTLVDESDVPLTTARQSIRSRSKAR